jgi:hypothetical protein
VLEPLSTALARVTGGGQIITSRSRLGDSGRTQPDERMVNREQRRIMLVIEMGKQWDFSY